MRFLDPIRPAVGPEAAAKLTRDRYGVEGVVTPLYGERDRAFRVAVPGEPGMLLRVFSCEEEAARIAATVDALLHVAATDPEFVVPRPLPQRDGAYVSIVTGADGAVHHLLAVSWVPGAIIGDVAPMPDLLRDHGRSLARLGRALRGFYAPAFGTPFLWDVRQAPALLRHAGLLRPDARRTVTSAVETFAKRTLPGLAGLRAQIIHNDAGPFNVIVDPARPGRVAGIIDFGDMVHGSLAQDLSAAIGDMAVGARDSLETTAALVRGYGEATPLEEGEVEALFDLVQARLSLTVLISAWRRAARPSEENYITPLENDAAETMAKLDAAGRDRFTALARRAAGLPSLASHASVNDLLLRRQASMGRGLALFYDPPLHLVRGEGVWLEDASGRRYLDCYNNVPHVGHCHPHVVAAIARQAAMLNTNTRYLFGQAVDYAERLAATMPDGDWVCAFVNSGSEANDLAWRMAKAFTGRRGGICMEFAYHGITDAMEPFSPSADLGGGAHPHMRHLPAPDGFRGAVRYGEPDFAARYAAAADIVIDSLEQAGFGTAAFMLDSTFLTNGVLEVPPAYVQDVVAKVRAAGGLFIADEVQAGFGRMGEHFWGHAAYGVIPDMVTIGKPAGNGHPLGAVVARREIFQHFLARSAFFSTFGGNNVSCAAGMAVLDVMENEHLIRNAGETGAGLKAGLTRLAGKHALIGDVRGRGLCVGVELVTDRAALTPAAAETKRVLDLMRERGVLIGSEGVHGNILKIRPPMVLRPEHAERVVEALDECLARL
ncbi:MAG TPA: aminotransferase class III-fold pyridoxal phosphate-dependent enzyme [Mesorhizobium sp.]|jgi:4-aminobutyrate aminotransferase-like enzyme/Ser/Thr protein kinase RdoA (MazF antagonist)|nr:aminotransferase class III-fold pyridoxal phosphate-dependent enzyme [Mesorhizobium sp.]